MTRGRKADLDKLRKNSLGPRRWISALLLLVGVMALLAANGSHWRARAATNWYVSVTGSNTNPGTISSPFQTLSRAIEVASAGDTIFVFDGIYTNPGNYVTIDKDLTIRGLSTLAIFNVGVSMGITPSRPYFTIAQGRKVTLGNLIFNGNPIEYDPPRSCHIEIQPGADVTIDSIFARNAHPTNPTVQTTRGGSIYNAGTLTVTNSIFENNRADEGGGIYNAGTLTVGNNNTFDNSGIANVGTLILNNSTLKDQQGTSPALANAGMATVTDASFYDNRVTNSGGAIVNASGGTLKLVNSTLSGNSADQSGGAIVNALGGKLTITNSTLSGNTASMSGGGISNNGTLDINFCTLANNSATVRGGGIFNSNTGTLKIKNSLVANNPTGGDCANESGGAFIALGKNFDTDGSGAALDSDFTQVSAAQLNLGILGGNGGPTATIALGTGSVAIDAAIGCTEADGITPINQDQRGQFRCQCDVGAYEVATPPDNTPPTIIPPPDQTVGANGVATTAQVFYPAPTVSDNCSNVGAPVCTPASGSAFPLGVTTVTCSVKDAANNSNSGSFKVTVNNVSAGLSDPLSCTGPGATVTGTIQITNNGNVAANAAMTTALPAGLLALPGTCAASIGACSVVNDSTISYSNSIPAGQTVTISYQAQIGDQVATGTQLCALTEVSFNGGPKASVSPCVTVNCPGGGPGSLPDAKSPVSDQKAGSVLFYNLYTSSASNYNSQNTRINLTNTHMALEAQVHLFFVDGSNCSVADSYVCLTPNQTTSFLMSDLDPGTTGYLIAVAVDERGCPINFNYLIGDEYLKFASGHEANLGAEAVAAIAGGLPLCDDNSSAARLNFDGVSYNRLPRALALSNIASRGDGNDTLLALNRIGGDLAVGAAKLTSVFGIFYDDAEQGMSFSLNPNACQFRSSITNSFPRVTPRFEQFIPPGRSGWLKLYSTEDQAILGIAINFNQNAGGSAGAFSQGHNLHKLTLTSGAYLTIPVFPPSC